MSGVFACRAVIVRRWRRARSRTAGREFARLGVTLGAAAAGAAAWHRAGLVINHTASLPRGLYRVWRTEHGAGDPVPARGSLVAWCLPAGLTAYARGRAYVVRGACPAGGEPILKLVAAVPGDTMRVAAEGLAVDGVRLANSRPRRLDSRGRPMRSVPPGTYPVRPGEVWLWSPHNAHSFDSRYYGALPIEGWIGVAHPLWTR